MACLRHRSGWLRGGLAEPHYLLAYRPKNPNLRGVTNANRHRIRPVLYRRLAIFCTVLMAGWLVSGKVLATPPLMLGSEVLAADGFRQLKGKRVGLLTNPSGVNRQGRSTIDLLARAPGVRLVALFAAEHGLYGDVPAGKEYSNHVHQATGLPVYSLYGPGPVRQPTPIMLKDIDILVYDLQDVGCRSYTFISTMGLAMESCAKAGVEFMVLDRPNPMGGLRVEGPMLNPRLKSLVGQWEIPYVYGLTSGELATLINRSKWIKPDCRLTVVKMRGWRRDMTWRDTGLKWVPTSPNIPRGDSPLYYAATGLLGSVGGVNIGFDLKMPFECVTAPWLNGPTLSQRMKRYGLKGVEFVPFSQTTPKYTQQGVRLVFRDPARAPVVALNFYLMEVVRRDFGHDLFAEAVKEGRNFTMLDKVAGTEYVRIGLQKGHSAESIVKSWRAGEERFRQKRQPCLLY
jgi:uncharacterized protein YbbC (DUF1343 family)